MGYCYGYNAAGRMVLACDNCGNTGGVRKRRCIFKVLGDAGRGGQRYEMDYCPAPALCAGCYAALGGAKKLHAGCESGARASQAEYDANQAKLEAGEYMLNAGWGDWAEWVPEGKTGALFRNLGGEEKWVLIDKEEYGGSGRHKWLGEYSAYEEVEGEGRAASKQVALA
jgi:hypothetical protein